jgi:serine/threonine-protein kinase RsbW
MRTDFIRPDFIPRRAPNAGAFIDGGPEKIKMVIPADVAAIEKVSAAVNDLLVGNQWPMDEVMKVDLALQEALANAIRHGCRNDASKLIDCRATLSAAELAIVVRDPGPGFDVSAVANPLDAANLFKPGGRGIFLINQLMDTVEFTDGGRQVSMRKRRGGRVAVT